MKIASLRVSWPMMNIQTNLQTNLQTISDGNSCGRMGKKGDVDKRWTDGFRLFE